MEGRWAAGRAGEERGAGPEHRAGRHRRLLAPERMASGISAAARSSGESPEKRRRSMRSQRLGQKVVHAEPTIACHEKGLRTGGHLW